MAFSTLTYSLADDGIASVVFDEPGSPVNTMKPEWQADMVALADRLQADNDKLQGVIFSSAKTTFFAGADLKGVQNLIGFGCTCTHGIEQPENSIRLA